MKLLSPRKAAALADNVYAVNENPGLTSAERILLVGSEPEFSVVRPQQAWAKGQGRDASHPFARAESGTAYGGLAPLWPLDRLFNPVESDFGYCAIGNKGWQRHMIIVTRGTMGASKLAPDWISNYNVGLRPAIGGGAAHAGFLTIWQQFMPFIEKCLRFYSPTYVHCVGHSLGGALATLNANYIASRRAASVALYTFGAPRVGDLAFATQLTLRVGAERMKRVYHPADPVPMIPLLPFIHAPLGGGIRLDAPAGALIDDKAHDMAGSYRAAVRRFGQRDGWGELEGAHRMLGDFQIDRWLRQAAAHKGGWLMRSAVLLENIGRGLGRLLQRAAVMVIGSGLSAAATAALTSLDLIAWLLARAVQISAEIAEEVAGLVRAIFGFLGRAAAGAVDLTRRALRWVLDLLYSFLAAAAHVAIGRLP